MDNLEKVMAADLSKVNDFRELKKALEAQWGLNQEEIQKLALSASSDDNSERIKLLGQQELIIKIISAVK